MRTQFLPQTIVRRQQGTAVIIMLAILSIVLIYVGTNVRNLRRLDREIKLTEQRQLQRLEAHASPAPAPALTNSVPDRPVP